MLLYGGIFSIIVISAKYDAITSEKSISETAIHNRHGDSKVEEGYKRVHVVMSNDDISIRQQYTADIWETSSVVTESDEADVEDKEVFTLETDDDITNVNQQLDELLVDDASTEMDPSYENDLSQHNKYNSNTADSRVFSSVMPWLNRSDGVHQTYLLSAFWDDRWKEVSKPFISTLVFMERTSKLPAGTQMYLSVQCGDSEAVNPQVYKANMTDIHKRTSYRKSQFSNTKYLHIIIKCFAEHCLHPERISVGYRENSVSYMDDTNSVPVEYPVKEQTHEFGICVPPIFGCLNSYQLIEWMEIQKLLGVSKVIIHNNTQCEDASRVLEAYGRQGLVEIRQDHTVLPVVDMKYRVWNMIRHELFTRDPLMLTDCMYRHMYDVKYLFFVDLDEVLVPQNVFSLSELVDEIRDAYPSPNGTEFNQLTFKNFFFLMDNLLTPDPVDTSFPNVTSMLQHRKRLGPSPTNKRRKSIVLPTACEFVHNHYCTSDIRNLKEEAPRHRQIFISEDIGKVHHYRNSCCEDKGDGMKCAGETPPSPVISDDVMLRYKHQHTTNVRKQLQLLGYDG